MGKFLDEERTRELWQSTKDYTIPTKFLSQEEYDSLPDEQKNENVIYATPQDKNSGGSSGGSSNLDVYSTEETRIGTWIDGKPIYRRTFAGTFLTAEMVVMSNADIDVLIGAKGCILYGSNLLLSIPYLSSTGYVSVYAKINENNLYLYSRYSETIGKQYSITVEYTKTTD